MLVFVDGTWIYVVDDVGEQIMFRGSDYAEWLANAIKQAANGELKQEEFIVPEKPEEKP